MAKPPNEVLRDFERFTGDGLPNEPVGAPLPVGDPKSGPHQISRKDMRDALNAAAEVVEYIDLGEFAANVEAVAEGVGRAETARDQAEAYASAAGTAGTFYDTIAEGRAAVTNGQTFGVIAEGSDNLTRPTLFRRDSSSTQTELLDMIGGAELDAETAARIAGDRAIQYPFPTEKLLAAWLFDEGAGDVVRDQWSGLYPIDLTLPSDPNAAWTSRGIRLASGLIQTPTIPGARQIVILYRTGFAQTPGFLISGGVNSGSGITQQLINTVETTRYAGSGYGWHPVAHRASTGAAAFELNRGGWGLLSREMTQQYNTPLGLGGRHSMTTSRCADFEIAMAFVFDAVLAEAEEDALLAWVRQRAAARGIYIHRDDGPTREDVYIIAGESNAAGRSLISGLSADDRALRLDRHAAILPANSTTRWRSADGFDLGFNQKINEAPSSPVATQFGPEFGVAFQRRAVAAARTRRARILKLGQGSTFMATSSIGTPPGSAPQSSVSWNVGELNTSGLFWIFLAHVQYGLQEMLAQGVGWDQVRMGFWIGLNDAMGTQYTTSVVVYQGYLQDMLDTIEAQFPGIDLQFHLFRAHPHDESDPTALAHVRDGSDAFAAANSNVTLVDTDSLGLEVDGVHYDAEASKAMGITLHG